MKNNIANNPGLKLLSFIFAFISWYYVIIVVNPEVIRVYSLKLDVYDRALEYEYSGLPEKIRIEVRGKRLDLIKLFKDKPFPVQAFISLKKTRTSHKIKIMTKKLVSFSDFEISGTFPKFINITSRKLTEKVFGVKYTILGSPSPGFKIGEPILEPEKVTILALEKNLKRLVSVMATIDITGASQDISSDVKLAFMDKTGEKIKGIKAKITEYINITLPVRRWPEKTVKVKAPITGTEPQGYKFISAVAEPSEVIIRGPGEKIKKMTALLLDPIDITGVTNEKIYEIECNTDKELKIIGPTVIVVKVTVTPKIVKKYINNVAVNLKNVSGKMNFLSVPDKIDILIEGPENYLSKEGVIESISAEIDVRKVVPGTMVTPEIKLSEKGVMIQALDVPKVRITDK